jgi:hypothetical protein
MNRKISSGIQIFVRPVGEFHEFLGEVGVNQQHCMILVGRGSATVPLPARLQQPLPHPYFDYVETQTHLHPAHVV